MGMVLDGIVAVLLGIIAWHDQKTMEIPDGFNIGLAVCGVASMLFCSEITVTERLIGACCVSVPMYLMICLIPESFGGGDVKLTFAMGLYLGWKHMYVAAFLACMIGGLQGVYLLASGKVRSGEGAHMAFGPALCAGCLIAMLWGEKILAWYLGWFY